MDRGRRRSARVITREGDLVVVDNPRYGRWSVLPVSSEAPRHVSYRGGSLPGQAPAEGASTLVEFFLTEHDSGTLLQLGFAKRDAERIRT